MADGAADVVLILIDTLKNAVKSSLAMRFSAWEICMGPFPAMHMAKIRFTISAASLALLCGNKAGASRNPLVPTSITVLISTHLDG